MDLPKLRARMREFADQRDWEQFHSPKNLSMALAAEAGELLEIFQWLTEQQSRGVARTPEVLNRVREEAGDILIYLVRLCDQLDVDLEEATWDKVEVNERKYPPSKSRGTAKKYTEF